MRAGALRHRVTLQSPAQERDGAGAAKRSYVDGPTVWASVEPLRGRELFAADKFANKITTLIKIRFQGNVDESWRVQHTTESMGTVYYGILAIVRPYAIKRELWLGCEAAPMGEPV